MGNNKLHIFHVADLLHWLIMQKIVKKCFCEILVVFSFWPNQTHITLSNTVFVWLLFPVPYYVFLRAEVKNTVSFFIIATF